MDWTIDLPDKPGLWVLYLPMPNELYLVAVLNVNGELVCRPMSTSHERATYLLPRLWREGERAQWAMLGALPAPVPVVPGSENFLQMNRAGS